MQELKEIQIAIKKELGGASLNHLLTYIQKTPKIDLIENYNGLENYNGRLCVCFNYSYFGFEDDFILLNENKHCNNIFDQSEEFQRKLCDAIQIIKNINNK
jgi:hypothetical protein